MIEMDCPHLVDYTSFLPEEVQVKDRQMQCSECSTNHSLWMCLTCGILNCGRYVNGHAMRHYEIHNDHKVTISTENASLYCYKCDNDIHAVVQNGPLEQLRKNIVRNNYMNGESESMNGDVKENDNSNHNTADTNDTRVLRSKTQKRSHPKDNENQSENKQSRKSSTRTPQKQEKKAVGLRNLGNTCFMNAVLQSLKYGGDLKSDVLSERVSAICHLSCLLNFLFKSDTNIILINGYDTSISFKQSLIENVSSGYLTMKVSAVRINMRRDVARIINIFRNCNIHPFSFYIKQLPSFEKLRKNSWNNVRQLRNSKECNDVLMAEELRKILLSLNCEYQGHGRNAISPESLFLVIWKVVPRFRGYQQQDAHEFLRYMLDRLHMELLLLLPELNLKDVNIGQKGRASIITCVFGGVLQSEVRCLNCSGVSKKQDPFLDLSLDIPDKYLPKHISSKRCKEVDQEAPVCNIHDCLSSFIEVEELAESEQYYCNNCKDKQRSTKRFWIKRLPNVLCLHLKRFRWINFYRMKLDTEVSFPVEFLDMSDFTLHDIRDTRQSCVGSNVYDLAAVIVHHGSGAGSGHYTAFAIHKGQWFHFNDSSVQQVKSATVAKCKPYILFYIRREVRLPKLFES